VPTLCNVLLTGASETCSGLAYSSCRNDGMSALSTAKDAERTSCVINLVKKQLSSS